MGGPTGGAIQWLGGPGHAVTGCRPSGRALRAPRCVRRAARARAAGAGASYGFVLHASVPMVGTYHRAGVSRWVPLLKPLVYLVGSGCRYGWPSPRPPVTRPCGRARVQYEVLYNGVDMERFVRAEPAPSDRPTVLFLGRHETRKGLSVLLDAFALLERPAVLWVAGDGPQSEVQRRRHPESDRVKWLGMLSDGRWRPGCWGRTSCAHRHCAASRSAWWCSRAWRPAAPWWHRTSRATARPPAVTPCWFHRATSRALSRALGVALADAAEGSGRSSPDALKAAEAHANGWSMESLAERYVEAYRRAIDIFEREHSKAR